MKALALLACIFLPGCATWNGLPLAAKLGVVATGAATAQSATGTAVNLKALVAEEKK